MRGGGLDRVRNFSAWACRVHVVDFAESSLSCIGSYDAMCHDGPGRSVLG